MNKDKHAFFFAPLEINFLNHLHLHFLNTFQPIIQQQKQLN